MMGTKYYLLTYGTVIVGLYMVTGKKAKGTEPESQIESRISLWNEQMLVQFLQLENLCDSKQCERTVNCLGRIVR